MRMPALCRSSSRYAGGRTSALPLPSLDATKVRRILYISKYQVLIKWSIYYRNCSKLRQFLTKNSRKYPGVKTQHRAWMPSTNPVISMSSHVQLRCFFCNIGAHRARAFRHLCRHAARQRGSLRRALSRGRACKKKLIP